MRGAELLEERRHGHQPLLDDRALTGHPGNDSHGRAVRGHQASFRWSRQRVDHLVERRLDGPANG